MSCVSQQEVLSFASRSPTPGLFCSPFTDLSNLIMSEHAEVMVSPLQPMPLRKKASWLNKTSSLILIFKFRKNQKNMTRHCIKMRIVISCRRENWMEIFNNRTNIKVADIWEQESKKYIGTDFCRLVLYSNPDLAVYSSFFLYIRWLTWTNQFHPYSKNSPGRIVL